ADYRRDMPLILELLKNLAAFCAMPVATPVREPLHASDTLATIAKAGLPSCGRKHRRKGHKERI
ncbi:unnamed protein product, partial [Symbiodinium pilosum]